MATSSSTSSEEVSSASAKALAAATSTKPRPSPLPTPHSATFPSSLQSPLPTPGFMRAERDKANMKTPMTPPSAYLEFLRNLDSKTLKTPLSTSKSAHFSFTDTARSPYPWPCQPASARPNLSSQDNPGSNTNKRAKSPKPTFVAPAPSPAPTTAPPAEAANRGKPLTRRASDGDEPSTSIKPSHTTSLPSHTKPGQAARRPSLIIPESPSTLTFNVSPPTAHPSKARSPATANAARNYYTSLSPEGSTPRSLSAPALGKPQTRPYSVRHVITRTVTYTRPAGTTATIPGVTPGTEAPTTAGAESAEKQPRSESSSSESDARETMSLDTILNSADDQRQKRKTDPGNEGESERDREGGKKKEAEITSPVGQTTSAHRTPTRSNKPLVGEVPEGKRRKVT